MRVTKRSRLIAALLSLCMMVSMLSGLTVFAGTRDDTGLCEHHPEHTEACGYIAASEGAPCQHVHDEACGFDPDEGQPCTHEHDEDCGYAEPTEGHPCTYVCQICLAGEADASEWDEVLRKLEKDYEAGRPIPAVVYKNQYLKGIAPVNFITGNIPWDFFTVNGLPESVATEAKWLDVAKKIEQDGYLVDNTGVKYTKFPQYDDQGIHFASVTVNGVEVVRAGILMPDDNPNGKPVYYYLTQQHVDSDKSDGSGSHTGSISALILPEGTKFTVNYAANEYHLTYEIQLDGKDVTNTTYEGTKTTWEQTIFSGQNPATTNNGAASFTVTIPYGYTATVWIKRWDADQGDWMKRWDEENKEWLDEDELTGERDDIYDEDISLSDRDKVVNEGKPLGTEPEYQLKDGEVALADNSPSAKRMSAVFYSDWVTENRHIIVKLVKDTSNPVFDAHWWMQTANAGNRGTTGKVNAEDPSKPVESGTHGNGNIQPDYGNNDYDWGVMKNNPYQYSTWSAQDQNIYDTHWVDMHDGTYNLYWPIQTNGSDNYYLNSLELNGVHIDIPFKPLNNWVGGKNGSDAPNTEGDGTSVTTATLPDGAQVELTYYRQFGDQRVYILTIKGARSNVTVTNGNLMQYRSGAPEYVATVLTGVTAEDNNSDTFGYYGHPEGVTENGWYTQAKAAVQVQETESNKSKTDFANGDTSKYGANLRFRLQDGYENPVFKWENRVSSDYLEGSDSVTPWPTSGDSDSLDGGMLKTNTIYGPDEDGYYYIRIGTAPGGNNKMCVLSLTATAMKYMVRYMVGSEGDEDTNAPKDENVENMPSFDTDDSSWDDDLIPKDENGNPIEGGIQGKHLERYDDNNGNFYDRQTTPKIPVSDAKPTTTDNSKFFQYWVLVGEDEEVITNDNGEPIIIRPNETIDLAKVLKCAVPLNEDIGGTDTNYYVIRLKGVWSNLPDTFKFYIRMVWTEKETGESHIMDLVQNVTTSSTLPNLTEDGCLVVTVNTVTDVFKNWFNLHPFYGYAARDFIPTKDRMNVPDPDGFVDTDGKIWEKYPTTFTEGSTEQKLPNENAHYRVEVGMDGIVRYVVQREGTIVLYLDQINGQLPIGKTVVGSNPGVDTFTYTVKVKLLDEDIKRNESTGSDYLTTESLRNMLPSGTFFGFAPDPTDPTMAGLKDFTGVGVELHFTRHAVGTDMTKWYSEATFTLKGGQATVLGVPQGSYTITEEIDPNSGYTVTVETDGTKTKSRTVEAKEVKIGEITSAVKYTNEVKPLSTSEMPKVSTEITGANIGNLPEYAFNYTLKLVEGSEEDDWVEFKSLKGSSETTNKQWSGTPFGEITFNHTGTYVFLVTETLAEGADPNYLISDHTSTRDLTIVVENINGQLQVTQITVNGTVYKGDTLSNAVVAFTHAYFPIQDNAVRVIPTVNKVLKGRSLLSSSFEFELTYNGETLTATNNAAANGEAGAVTFPPIDIMRGDTVIVTVKEKIPPDAENNTIDGIVYDSRVITITYTVDADGNVTTTYSGGKGANQDTFENSAYAEAMLNVKKNYDVHKRINPGWQGDTFTVTAKLTEAPAGAEVGFGDKSIGLNSTAEIELTEADKDTGKAFNFRFTQEGTYKFEVRETKGNVPGVSYDNSVYYVTVVVTPAGQTLSASLSITRGSLAVSGDTVTFDNAYDPGEIDVTVNAKKILQDANGNQIGLTEDQFSFELAPTGQTTGSTLTAKNDANGNVTFTLKGLKAGTYTYTLSEVAGVRTDVTYDDATFTVTVVVTDDGNGPTATVTYSGGDVPTFKNTVRNFGQLVVSNTTEGKGADLTKEFTFTFTFEGTDEAFRYELSSPGLTDTLLGRLVNDFVTPLFAPGSTAMKGTIKSGENIQLRDGQSVTIYGIPEGTAYTVTESDYTGYTVSHDGTAGDTASGTISIDDTKVNYTNTRRQTGTLTVTNKVTGTAGEKDREFHFVVTIDGVTHEFTLKNGDSKTFEGIPAGTEYTVTQTDANVDGYTTTVPGNTTGTIQANQTVTVGFVNNKNTTPTNPGTTPTNPGTDPTNPGTDPTNPGTDPTNPGTDPTNPGTDPTNPGTDPTNPGTDPTNPGTDPTNPGTDPTNPGTDPTNPGTDPTTPGTDPTTPTTPGTDPTEPTEPGTEPTEPTEPGTEPTDPTEPGVVPTEPTDPPADDVPKTGDDSKLALWVTLMVLSVIGMLSAYFLSTEKVALTSHKGRHVKK